MGNGIVIALGKDSAGSSVEHLALVGRIHDRLHVAGLSPAERRAVFRALEAAGVAALIDADALATYEAASCGRCTYTDLFGVRCPKPGRPGHRLGYCQSHEEGSLG